MKEDNSLVVIGAGLPRTGTASLKKALEIIFDKPCYHMFELKSNHPEHTKLWSRMFEACLIIKKRVINEKWIRNIFAGYGAVVDAPACALYEPMMELYPDAKIILTVRDPHVWVQSIRSTIISEDGSQKDSWINRLTERISMIPGFFQMTNRFWFTCFGSDTNLFDDDQLIDAFNKWNASVRLKVPEHKLLIFDISTGWEPLCNFLGVPIPKEKFPHLNDRIAFSEHSKFLWRTRRWIKLGISFVGLGLVGLCLRHSNCSYFQIP